ncbi:MAG: pilus assembly PilX N-terminal domain-containing protein [Phycisphaerae bacterium]|nr:pilus assembly PilX N-terminal domain-containing protein [Phycisphaerae bacterium]
MEPIKKLFCRKHSGAAFVISMIFVLVFSALAVSMATLCDTNLQIAENQRKGDCARASAESGVDIIRFWLSRFSVEGATEQNLVFNELASPALVHSLPYDLTANSITNITTSYNGTTLTIPSVTLDSENSKSFSAEIIQLDADTLQMDVTGVYKTNTRTIRANYNFGVRKHTVFDYGVATKGPLSLSGNIELGGVNVSVESDVYIVSENSNLALEIVGNSQIAGDVHICNPLATADLQGGQASVGGETAPEAYDHITPGWDEVEFPVPNPEYFEHYVVEDINLAETTFTNVRIPPNTNPSFSGGVTINGVVFIETPNLVTFTGHVNITGIIVGNGDVTDDSGTNRIDFLGTVNSNPVTALPAGFGELREETGTFLMAPGFSLSFGGDFETINGAIAANGITFSGNAGGTIEGSVLNYADTEMELSGNSDLFFNRWANTEIPAGFEADIVLNYDPTSYSEGPF